MRSLQPLMGWFALSVTAGVLIALWLKELAGQDVSMSRWLLGSVTGVLSAWIVRVAVLISVARPRIVVFRTREIFLSDIGAVATGQIVHWSLANDSWGTQADPGCTRLEIICHGPLGNRRWSMLLDDPSEIARLRAALDIRLPRAAMRVQPDEARPCRSP